VQLLWCAFGGGASDFNIYISVGLGSVSPWVSLRRIVSMAPKRTPPSTKKNFQKKLSKKKYNKIDSGNRQGG